MAAAHAGGSGSAWMERRGLCGRRAVVVARSGSVQASAGEIVGERRQLEGERVRGGVKEERKTEAVGAGVKHI